MKSGAAPSQILVETRWMKNEISDKRIWRSCQKTSEKISDNHEIIKQPMDLKVRIVLLNEILSQKSKLREYVHYKFMN